MPNENTSTFRYRILRYTPNLVRDEWVNIGVLLEDPRRKQLRARLIEEAGEIARVRRLHPNADEVLLRNLLRDFDAQITAGGSEGSSFLGKLEETLSNVIQLSPQKGLLGEDFDVELDRLYHDHVAPPARRGRGAALLENTRAWIRTRVNEIFRRNHILNRMDHNIPVERFTQVGDPMRLDYGYRYNGTRGYAHALSLARDLAQAKVLAFTAERIRARLTGVEFAAITEAEPLPNDERHQFVASLLAEQKIELVPVARLNAFADRLRPLLQ